MQELYQSGFMVQNKTKTDDGLGGYIETWANDLEVDGILDLLSGETSDKANRPTETSTHIFMQEASDMAPTLAVLSINSRIIFDGKVYYVDYIDKPFNHHLEAYLRFDGDMNEV